MENLLPLAVGELDIKHPAIGFHHRQGIKFSFARSIGQRIEVSPVDLHLLTGGGLEADKGLPVFQDISPLLLEVIPDYRYPAVKPFFLKPLKHHRRLDARMLLEQIVDEVAMGIQLGTPRFLRDDHTLRMLQIFSHSVPAEPDLSGNIPCRIARMLEPVDLENSLPVNHRGPSARDCRIIRATSAGSS